jgi:hypothetical protein
MNSDNFKQNFINAVLGKLGSNTKYSPEIEQYLVTVPPEQRQGVANGLNFGNKDILANQQRLGINIPQGEEQIALARQGQFNLPTEGATRQGGLINGYNQGYNLNYDNPTNQISTRIGQALGTIKRGADSPLGRAVIAYGASRMMGDANPLKQAATAYGTRENVKTADQLYRKQLNNMGVDTSGINGEINADMVKTLSPLLSTGTKFTTLGALAMYDEGAKARIAAGADPNTIVPNTLAKDIANNVRGLNDARINNLNAKTKTEDLLRDAKYQKIMNDINTAQQRVAIARQKLANGTISASDYAKELKNWTSLVNALDKYEGLSDDTKALVGKPPVRQQGVATPAPQAQPKKSGVTKNGVKWEVVE